MDKMNQSYETIFVVDTTLGDEAVKALVEKFTALIAANGEITQANDWGKRRLAYPINDRTEGYYTLVYFKAPAEFASELDRIYNINDGILRSIIVREDEKMNHAAAVAVPAVITDDNDDEPVKTHAKPAEKAAEAPAEESPAAEPAAEEPAQAAAEEKAAD